MVGAALGVVLVIVAGHVSDRVGRKRVFSTGATLALLFAFPAAWHRRLRSDSADRGLAVSLGDGTLWWVATYNAAIAVVSLVCARLLPETRGRDLRVDEAPVVKRSVTDESRDVSPTLLP